jgi:hypothetical protein
MNKKFKELILISSKKDDLDFLNILSQKLNMNIKTYQSVSDSPDIYENSLVFVDVSSEEAFFSYENYTKRFNKIHSHFISDQQIHDQRYIPKSPSFTGFIQRGNNSIDELANQYIHAIQCPSIESLNQKPILSKTINFTNTRQKYQAIESVAQDLKNENISNRIIAIVSNAVDEIVMNSMFDSKIDGDGHQVYRFTPRTAEFDLIEESSVSLNYSLSEDYIILSATDNYGSFNREKFYDYIAQIFLSGGSVFLYCEPGKKTEVFVLFKKTKYLSEFKSQSKFITTSVANKAAA